MSAAERLRARVDRAQHALVLAAPLEPVHAGPLADRRAGLVDLEAQAPSSKPPRQLELPFAPAPLASSIYASRWARDRTAELARTGLPTYSAQPELEDLPF